MDNLFKDDACVPISLFQEKISNNHFIVSKLEPLEQDNDFLDSIKSSVLNPLFEDTISYNQFAISKLEQWVSLFKDFAHFLENNIICFPFILLSTQYVKTNYFIHIV